MAEVRIRVGAAADQSLRNVFRPLVEAAKTARRQMQTELGTVPRQLQGVGQAARLSGRQVSDEFSRAAREAERAMRREHAAIERGARASAREQIRLAREVERARAQAARGAATAELREARRAATEARRLARTQSLEADRFATRTSHRATRFFMPTMPITSMARRGVGDIMRGAGVDMSLQGSVGRFRGLEASATELSNSAFNPLQGGANAKRVAPAALMAEARALGASESRDPQEVVNALAEFTKMTGDLATARNVVGDLSALAGATGTNLGDMAGAAANVANALGDMGNEAEKGKRINTIMRTIAAQGKLGAVEIKDLAVHMARIAAVAPQFEGSVDENIKRMGALTQISRATGGAPSAAEAARSVVGFASTLQKGARIKAFEKAGINVFADEGKTQFKNPFELIGESLMATGGNLQEMNKLFMDVVGARAVKGLATRFNQAGGGDAGLKAVNDDLQKFMGKANISDDEIKASNAARQQTAAAKAQRFQNQIDQIVEKSATTLIPALEKLAPMALKAAEGLSKIVNFAANNPGQAFVMAIVASIARAGLESAMRAALERVILGAGRRLGLPGLRGAGSVGGGPGGPQLPPGGAAAGGLMGRPTALGVLGAIGGGAALGLTAHTVILEAGKAEFDTNTKDLNALSSKLSKLSGAELANNMGDITKEYERIKGSRGTIDKVFGLSDTEFDSFDSYYKAKKLEAENLYYGKTGDQKLHAATEALQGMGGRVPAPLLGAGYAGASPVANGYYQGNVRDLVGGPAGGSAEAMRQGLLNVETALRTGVLKVQVVNAADLTPGAGQPGVGPGGAKTPT